MARVRELTPGDLVLLGGRAATFVAETAHPLWPKLRLVVWRLRGGEWSHDALGLDQEVGDVEPGGAEDRERRLREALLHRRPWRLTCLGL